MEMSYMMYFDVAAPPPEIFTGRETMASFCVFILENRASAPGIFAEKVSHLEKFLPICAGRHGRHFFHQITL